MTCPNCIAASSNEFHGIYSRDCIDCCIREVMGAESVGKDAQLQIIESYAKHGAFSEAEIKAQLKWEL